MLRWQDTGEEVALFGVNYYAPFYENYRDLKTRGADHRKVIDQDRAHFARVGLDGLRLHVFDREVSDAEGNLLSNEHLELLDYLVFRARQRGLDTVLTPIAWWPVPGASPGFATWFTMLQMTTDPAARVAPTNYLMHFARHTNRFTGRGEGRPPDEPAADLGGGASGIRLPAGTPGPGGPDDRLRPGERLGVNVCFGAWLHPGHAAAPHGLEIARITVE